MPHAHVPRVTCSMVIVQEIGPSTFHLHELPRAPTLGRCLRMKGTHTIYVTVHKTSWAWSFVFSILIYTEIPMFPRGPVYTMYHEVGPWKMASFHGPTSMVRIL